MMQERNTLVGPQLQGDRYRFRPDWKRLSGFLVVITLGSVVATQWLANSYGFHRVLGLNLFHIYPPWDYFIWAHQWEGPGNHALFAQAFGMGSLVTFAGCFVILLDLARANFRVNPFLHGSARWADKRDIRRAGLLAQEGVYVGAWRDKGGVIRYLRHDGPEHVLCYAPTRSGKGVALVVPTLLSWTESVFVTDLKGELYELTAGWRQKYAHNKILRFEPAASEGSCCFNPLDELRIGTEYEVADVQNLALLIVDPRGVGVRPGDYFPEAAYSLLVGCLLHLCYKSRADGVRANFAALDEMLATPGQDIKSLWIEMIGYGHTGGRNHPAVGRMGQEMINMAANQASGVLSTTRNFLSLYRDPVVARNTSKSDFRIRDLMHHENPVSLYIVTQPVDKDRLRPLVRIIVNMIVRLLADKMAFENGRPKPTYKHKLLAMIDEFPALGKLEILQQSLAFVAGYGIKCYLIAQDINQLKSRETGYGPDEAITSNCGIQCAFPPNRLETAEHLSRLTGQTTIIKEQVTRSGRGMGVQMSASMSEVQRPLLTPDECLRMPGPQKDANDRITVAGDMVVYCAGFPAIYGRQPLYFQDPTFAARAAVKPPKQSDAL
ncbi:MAG: type IV secretory system conjugative DNA transfer family protein [Verrucomicrobia bacterium]|nr:type IV secretory system conjugative DNA transfer family protein [Verrucomicrobiota bacterium]